MTMKKIIKFNHRCDYGHDWYVQVLNLKGWSLLQASVSWNDCPSWPYFQIKSGMGNTFSFLFWVHRFGLDIDILSRTWNWDYLKDLEENNVQ